MEQKSFIVTEYLAYRAELRKFDLLIIEQIVRYGQERYFDTETGRRIVIGEHPPHWVMIAYEENDKTITPITIHATHRQQIKFRINTGRFIYE